MFKHTLKFIVIALFFFTSMLSTFTYAATAEGPYVVNVSELANTLMQESVTAGKPAELHQHHVPGLMQDSIEQASSSPEPAATPEQSIPSPLPTINFEGHDQSGWIPPDTNGAVSSDFVLSTVNNDANIRDRNGNLLKAFSLNQLWLPTGSPGNSFDSRSRFDPYAQRFMILASGSLGMYQYSSILLAVSQTSDPTGNWNVYRIPADPPLNQVWADYPTIGFNSKWIAVHSSMFPGAPGSRFTTRLWAFDKASLYAGGPGNYTVLPGLGVTVQPAETYDATAEDLYLLHQNSNSSVELFRLTGPVGAESTVRVASVPAPERWTGGIPSAPQLGSSVRINPGINWVMDCVYRNGSIWGTQVVQPIGGPARSAVQWWRISTEGELQDFGRVDDPTGHAYYGFPAIAVNANNDALVGYTRFSADTYPSAAYSYRAYTDLPGTMRAPVIYKYGVRPYNASRWGDFSHSQVDPVNDLDFWTVQEISGYRGWTTWWAKVDVPQAEANIDLELKTSLTGVITNNPMPRFRIHNNGYTGLDLKKLTLRYWFDCDCDVPSTTFQSDIDWAGTMPAGTLTKSCIHPAFETTLLGNQTHAFAINFDNSAPIIYPGDYLEIHSRFNQASWGNMDQSNDWSYLSHSGFYSWNKVTAYLDNVLFWGIEP